MNKYRDAIASNLVYLRRKNNLTQQELAIKINYSDNAISRWERAEVTPTIETLEIVADFYGVTVANLIDERFSSKDEKSESGIVLKRIFIALFSISIVWLFAIISFIYVEMFKDSLGENARHAWLIFISALPISCLLAYYFNRLWGTKLLNLIIWSIFVWTVLANVYLYLLMISNQNFWLIFILGAPAQLAMILWYFIRR
ncbi:MAG: helix-turn-helix transcriptional regulator [Erysipelotrichia bacterium]|jgi:transcriptional regulator with XRE-family HTH domain|nr:helix-turn-helix transcriptional regulator [Erysipelotrichia bacterium]